jgi:hypothetical protein
MSPRKGEPHLTGTCSLSLVCRLFEPQEGADPSQLGPGYAAILVSATDAGLGGKLQRAMQGISTPQAIASSALTSALAHPEDAAIASFNINVCGSDKVRSEKRVGNDRHGHQSDVALFADNAMHARISRKIPCYRTAYLSAMKHLAMSTMPFHYASGRVAMCLPLLTPFRCCCCARPGVVHRAPRQTPAVRAGPAEADGPSRGHARPVHCCCTGCFKGAAAAAAPWGS